MSKSAAKTIIQDFSSQVAETVKHLPAFFHKLSHDLLLPAVYTLLCLYVLAILYNIAEKRLRPKTAQELHHQALQLLQSTRRNRNPKSDAQAVALLWEALDVDPTYTPAIQTLAAYYIYRQPNPSAALKILCMASKTSHLDRLRADAQALASNNSTMVQADFGEDEYLSLKSV